MKNVLAGAMAVSLLGASGFLGGGVAAAENTAYVVGGAKAPGFPWYEVTNLVGRAYYPNADRVLVDYPAGMLYGRLPSMLDPASDKDTPTVGESVTVGTANLESAMRSTKGPAVAVGLSEGTLVLDALQRKLANDPNAPAPDQLSFTVFGDPSRTNSIMATMPPGTYIPIVDYTVPEPVVSQYHTNVLVAEYDAFADWPDRPENLLSVANALIASTTVHSAVAFLDPKVVPPANVSTTTNARGGTTTTYLVPFKQLPMTLPLRYLGMDDPTVDQIDAVLRPMVDAGYSRYDGQAPRSDPVDGVDLGAVLDKVNGLIPSIPTLKGGDANTVDSLFKFH